ncbi:hypothetical protein [Pseudonocardia spinosispora]|uniref:hypothetical protein n=1 Tax=Pseudonocardia spinosispora TaxID=103441 RepID=UPI000403184D|nr:hypothetical protein [Pseudonocardia spinosispora]
MATSRHSEPDDRRDEGLELSLGDGFARTRISVEQLWTRQIGLGGNLTQDQLEAGLHDQRSLGTYDHDVLAQALNEQLMDQGYVNHPVSYSDRG